MYHKDGIVFFSLCLVAQFMYIIRKRIQLPPEKAMFLFVNKVLPTTRFVSSELHILIYYIALE